jgi:hypothetical protein
MATLADLKTRIITETNRDDLLDDLAAQLALAINQAIDFYSSQRFWFNETIATAPCVIGNEYVVWPTGMITLDSVSCLVGSIKMRMTKRSLLDIENLAGAVNSQGQPTDYAVMGSQVRVWPKPNKAYVLTFVGVGSLSALVNTTDTNAWTTSAQDLIVARSKYLLYRDQFRDAAGAQIAKQAETEALAALTGLANRKLGTGRVRASW